MKSSPILPFVITLSLLSACPSEEQNTTAETTPTPSAANLAAKKVISADIQNQKDTLTTEIQAVTPYHLKQAPHPTQVYKKNKAVLAIRVTVNTAQKQSVQFYYYQQKKLFLFEEKGKLTKGKLTQDVELSLSWNAQNQIQDVIYYLNQNAQAVPASHIQEVKAQAQLLLEQEQPPEVFKGIVTQEAQNIRFHPCHSSGSYRLNAPELLPKFSQYDLLPGEPMSLAFEGHLKDRQYQLKKVSSFAPWKPDGSCFNIDFVAQGIHPDWTLTFLKDKQVFFKAIEGEFPAVEHFTYAPPKRTNLSWVYDLQLLTGPQSQMQVKIDKKECELKGKTWPYQVQIKYFDIHYSGCANNLSR